MMENNNGDTNTKEDDDGNIAKITHSDHVHELTEQNLSQNKQIAGARDRWPSCIDLFSAFIILYFFSLVEQELEAVGIRS